MKIEKAKELLTMKLKDIPKGRQITLQAPFLHGYAYGEIAHRYCRQNTYQASCLYIKSVSTEEGFTRGVMIHLASDAKVTPMPNGSFFIDMVN